MKLYIQLFVVLIVLCVAAGCSHLHVDLDSHWRLSPDAHVAIVVEQPPAEVSVSQVTEAVYALGWQKPAGSQPDAQLLCRWQRVDDLTADSEKVQTVKSFHARMLNAENGQLIGVADYFYADGEMDMWTGVENALRQLYEQITVQPSTVPEVKKAVPSEPKAASAISADSGRPVDADLVTEPVSQRVTPDSPQVVQSDSVELVTEQEPAPVVEDEKPQPHSSGLVYQTQESPSLSKPVRLTQDSAPAQHSDSPSSMEKSPWIPRFQGMGLENWGKEDVVEE